MTHLTNMELDSLRHIIGECDVRSAKLDAYARRCGSPELRDWCRREAERASRLKEALTSYLSEGM